MLDCEREKMRNTQTKPNPHFTRSASGGFSLIELMIVIIILGLLASLVMPNIMGKGEEAKQKLVCIQMKNIGETLKLFKLDNGLYPTTEEGLEALVTNPDTDKYPNYSKSAYFENGKLPKDSWQSPFIYLATDDGFDLISLGADRKEGGEGDGADIRFSECAN
jgi:general secretion pathway protein G